MTRNLLLAALIFCSILGLADSLYLAISAATASPLVCDLGAALSGCNIVAQSSYSRIFGIPLADLGLLFFGLLFLGSLITYSKPHVVLDRIILVLAVLGALLSVAFLYIQFALIEALCVYCIGSSVLSFVVLLLAFLLVRKYRAEPLAVVP